MRRHPRTESEARSLFVNSGWLNGNTSRECPPTREEYLALLESLRQWISSRRDDLLTMTSVGRDVLKSNAPVFTFYVRALHTLAREMVGFVRYCPPYVPDEYTADKAVGAIDLLMNWCRELVLSSEAAVAIPTDSTDLAAPKPVTGPVEDERGLDEVFSQLSPEVRARFAEVGRTITEGVANSAKALKALAKRMPGYYPGINTHCLFIVYLAEKGLCPRDQFGKLTDYQIYHLIDTSLRMERAKQKLIRRRKNKAKLKLAGLPAQGMGTCDKTGTQAPTSLNYDSAPPRLIDEPPLVRVGPRADNPDHFEPEPAAPLLPDTLDDKIGFGASNGGLLPFDLVTIFRCAVELGAAVKNLADGASRREVETASERLMHVLNPRSAVFPTSFARVEFEAMGEAGIEWTRSPLPQRGWHDELRLAEATASARQALLTLALALADLRGDPQWHGRGQELLSAGAWNLWDGMGPAQRAAARNLLAVTHRFWCWSEDPTGEPGTFTGLVADLSQPRIFNRGWRTGTAEDLNAQHQQIMQMSNYCVDGIVLAKGSFQMCRYDVRRSCPICAQANAARSCFPRVSCP